MDRNSGERESKKEPKNHKVQIKEQGSIQENGRGKYEKQLGEKRGQPVGENMGKLSQNLGEKVAGKVWENGQPKRKFMRVHREKGTAKQREKYQENIRVD